MVKNLLFISLFACVLSACSTSSEPVIVADDVKIVEPVTESSAYDQFARSMTIAKNNRVVLLPLDDTPDQNVTEDEDDEASLSPYSDHVTVYEFGHKDAQNPYQ